MAACAISRKSAHEQEDNRCILFVFSESKVSSRPRGCTTLLSLYLSCWSYVQFLPSQARNHSGGHTTVSNDAARNLSQFVAQPESDRVSSTTDICMILSDILINSCLFSYEQIFSDSKTVLQSYNSAARSQQKVKDIQLHYLHSLT